MMIITLASSKGGVGKSTTTAALAGALTHAGHRVHIVDLDSNHTVSRWLGDGSRCPALSVSAGDPQDLTEHLSGLSNTVRPDIVLIDIAGAYERALTVAVARAHLTVIPAAPSEADIFEAARVARHIRSVFQAFGREPLYRALLTRVQPLASHAQLHAVNEIVRLRLPVLKTAIAQRAAYTEIGLSGLPPHYADASRPTVGKAVAELDALVAEIGALTGFELGVSQAMEVAS